MPWRYVTSDISDEEIAKTFCEKELQNTNQKEKSKINKLVIRRLETTQVGLSKLMMW